jgi:hypothetical protein
MKQSLLVLGYLLHVEALVLSGLVAEQVPDAKAIGGRDQRGCQSLQGAGPDGGNHGGFFTGYPAQSCRGVGCLDLTAQAVDLEQPGFLVDAQHLAHLGRAMPKDSEEGFDALAQQADDQGFRQGQVEPVGKAALK